VPSILTTSKYFLRKRLFATSINILGACLGAGLYPLFSEYILRKYKLFDTIFILSGVQLNCLIGSLLLRDKTISSSSSFSSPYNNNSIMIMSSRKNSSVINNKVLINNYNNNNSTLNSPLILNSNKKNGQNGLNKLRDIETESTTSASTNTAPNYTLKQYWRKFVQTRRTPSNAKKNLFHLIAEEKRKTRTMSKQSLEDGFYITTSNNLLAPNDEKNVVISRLSQNQKQNQALNLAGTNDGTETTANGNVASRFFTRIANSLRSLTHHHGHASHNHHPSTSSSNHYSPIATTEHSKNHLAIHELNETTSSAAITTPSPSPTPKNTPYNTPNVNTNTVTTIVTSPQLIPLMSVFNGPIINNNNELAENHQNQQQIEDNNNNNETVLSNAETSSIDHDFNDYDDENEEYGGSASPHLMSSGAAAQYYSQNAKILNARYLNYRNSLTSSVRGSLLECSVPEDREDFDNSNQQRLKKYFNSHYRAQNTKSRFSKVPVVGNKFNNSDSKNTHTKANANKKSSDNRFKRNLLNSNPGGSGYALPSLFYIRRFLSTIDSGGSSLFNAPLNLEPIEFNLRNSLIKKCSDVYRKYHRKANNNNKQDAKSVFFLDYLAYLCSYRVYTNPLLFMLNFSFFLSMSGLFTILFYLRDYALSFEAVQPSYSVYILSWLGFMAGLGRLISTITYKVNQDSTPKSRIFSYVLTTILLGLLVLVCTLLCDTNFSFSMFGIVFGVLTGFSLNLRTLLVYDIMGLEWSDDSLFCYMLLSHAFGSSFGLCVASFLYDLYRSYLYLMYYASACFLVSGLVLTPGRDLRKYCESYLKPLNRFYLQKIVM
jgi:hypothetical protein